MQETHTYCDDCGEELYDEDGMERNGAHYVDVHQTAPPFGTVGKATIHLCHDCVPERFRDENEGAEFFFDEFERRVVAAKLTRGGRYGGDTRHRQERDFDDAESEFADAVEPLARERLGEWDADYVW